MNSAVLGVPGGGVLLASSVMIDCLKALYGTAKYINDYLNEQIEEMKGNDNPTVARTGDILEKAKLGFGVGFIAPTVVIAVGQVILGNPLSAVAAVATVPLSPISMTCAAVGAIYYGWNVLSEKEKEEIISRICHGLQVGAEIVKSIISFIINKSKEAWNSENLTEVKKFVSATAAAFGKTLGNVTHKLTDKVLDAIGKTKVVTGKAIEKTGDAISHAIGDLKTRLPNKEKEDRPALAMTSPSSTRVKINSKGQITIPSALRREIGLTSLSELELVIDGDNITISKVVAPDSP
ncbi:AbrB/MazE/SpoVT family DNA-binding domain-containing protein [Geomonas anaerohicana]|uniref:AbrB/MazE/SpoVT family DNA-binding domain-containing protein n=1 Tax=Geomonas anaerohicana TaxID=2798583 RepID=A0ABS0YC70_9BACT|nr:AbrB/MazE/SpoVT family DNA-binding domain-containing protein [Geomonas anaerohicana]MBJ6749885.1 AbrB/MazE/SpoVT family DNA-binding domain-containing protein [Geomonas anaerohicana]